MGHNRFDVMFKLEPTTRKNGFNSMIKLPHTKLFFILSFVLLFSTSGRINAEDVFSESQMLSDALESEIRWVMAESVVTTKIATKTEMDPDLAPGMISVLDGKTLQDQGYEWVWDALALVPGVFSTKSPTGNPMSYFRGFSAVFGSNKIKMLLNGIPMNSTVYGGFMSLYAIPLEQVERIEIIRGPGSALYGKWAYAGVINVVTRTGENRVFGKYGRDDKKEGGALAAYTDAEHKLNIDLTVSAWEQEASKALIDTTVLTAVESTAPAVEINDSMENFTGVFKIGYKGFFGICQANKSSVGEHVGFLVAVPPFVDNKPSTEENRTFEIGYSGDILPTLKLDVYGGKKIGKFTIDSLWYFPRGYTVSNPYYDPSITSPLDPRSYRDIVYEDGIRQGAYYKEEDLFSGLNLTWTGLRHQTFLFGVEYENIRITDYYSMMNIDPVTKLPLSGIQRFYVSNQWLEDNMERNVAGFFIQDQLEIGENFSLTIGLRYDNYDDSDDRLTPRFAGVYRLSNEHIFKAQYAEAFRPPSYLELFTNVENLAEFIKPELKPEIVKTWELGYIFNKPSFNLKSVVFYSEQEDLIVARDYTYENVGAGKSQGVEIEAVYDIHPAVSLLGNISYLDAEDEKTGEEFANDVSWMGNLVLNWHPSNQYAFTVKYLYIGDIAQGPVNDREELSGYNTVDISAAMKHLFTEGLTLRAGIKNVFDDKVYNLQMFNVPDIPVPGRQWWFSLSYAF